MVVIVSVFRYNLAVGDTNFCSQCLLRRPLCVRKDYNRAQVAVYAHAVTQQFSIHCCHLFDVGRDYLSPVETFPRGVDKLQSDVCVLGSLRPHCDDSEELVDLILIHRPKVSFVCRL